MFNITAYLVAGALVLGIVGTVVGYSKGYTAGSAAVEMKYARNAAKIKGKMDNAKVPQSEQELLDDLKRGRF